jgi:FMN phosphatase YigB (HAD superfamily)
MKMSIIFDIGGNRRYFKAGVLFDRSLVLTFFKLPFFDFLFYVLLGNNPFNFENKFFEALRQIPPFSTQFTQISEIIPDEILLHNNLEIPNILSEWMVLDEEETIKFLEYVMFHLNIIEQEKLSLEHTESFSTNNIFLSLRKWSRRKSILIEGRLLKSAAELTFDPLSHVSVMKPVRRGISILRRIRKVYKKDEINVFILSNYEFRTFKLLQESYTEIFSLIDECMISGEVKILKPHKSIFRYALQKWNLKPEECLFVDDNRVNIHAAIEVGMKGILIGSEKEWVELEGLLF